MKVRIVFANKRFILKKLDPNSLITDFLDTIKSQIDKEFPHQYLIQHVEYSITDENQTLSFSCKTVNKELENNNHCAEIENLFTKNNLKKIFNMGTTFDINEVEVIPTRKLMAFEKIDINRTKIDPYFADYCARHEIYCKEMLKRNIQNIIIEYEQKTNNIEYCTGKLEEIYLKNSRLYDQDNVYHLFALAILRNEAFKNKLLSSGIRSVLMINNENDITLEVNVSAADAIYAFSIKKSNSLLTVNSESCPLLAMGVFATKVNGQDPDPEDRKYRLLSNSTYF